MKATTASAAAIGKTARRRYGRRRPKEVVVASLIGPTRSGTGSAKTPASARTSPSSVPDDVKRSRKGGRYAATVVIDQASPNAPSPSFQTRGDAPSSSVGGSAGAAASCARRLIPPARAPPAGRAASAARRL